MKKIKPEEREQIIHHLSDNAVQSLSECVYNIVKEENSGLDERTKKRLKKKLGHQKNVARVLASSSKSIKAKRKALTQHGGFLGTILGAAIPLLISLFSNLASKKK